MEFKYKKETTLQERINKLKQAADSFPKHIAIICEKKPSCKLNDLQKSSYLIEGTANLEAFTNKVKQYLQMDEDALFFYVNGKKVLTDNEETMQSISENMQIKMMDIYI